MNNNELEKTEGMALTKDDINEFLDWLKEALEALANGDEVPCMDECEHEECVPCELPVATIYEPGKELRVIFGGLKDNLDLTGARIRTLRFGRHELNIRFRIENVAKYDGDYFLIGTSVIYARPKDGVIRNLTFEELLEIGAVISKKEEFIQVDGETVKGFYLC